MGDWTEPVAMKDPCFIVAEVGNNHDGDLGKATCMIGQAKLAGAEAVKFQGFLADEIVPRNHPDYEYLKRTEVPRSWYPELKSAGEKNNIVVFSTASNWTTVEWMEDSGFPFYKIASGNLTHLPLIRKVAALGKPMILSTGYSDMETISRAVECVRETRNNTIALLHCVSNYPAAARELNLRFMFTLRTMFGCHVGYSDHHFGEDACKTAAVMGAEIIEKHVTLNPKSKVGDHPISSDFMCFGMMVSWIRTAEQMMGSKEKTIGDAEREGASAARRVLYAARDIPAGAEIAEGDILFLRPHFRNQSMTGKMKALPPEMFSWVLGRKTARDIAAQAPIVWQDMEMPGVFSG